MLVDNLAVCTLDRLFLEQDTLKISHSSGGDPVQNVLVVLLPPDWSLISRVLDFSCLSVLNHADHLMELQCFIAMEYVETLLTYKVIVQVGVLGL